MDQTTDSRTLRVGTVLNGQYIIHKVLGVGGFGITYLCIDNYLKKNVAIKEYFPSQIAYRDSNTGTYIHVLSSSDYEKLYKIGLEEYEHEANKLTKFSDYDGVVSVFNFFFENNTAYMVMEYVDGITLKQHLEDNTGRISCREMLSLMKPVLHSMKLIHDAGIIHRDISPDNIMITRDNRLTIIDFGAAKNRSDAEDSYVMLKHGYAPIEQYFRDGNQGPWTDVYALCATMYKMVSGSSLPKSIDLRNSGRTIPSLKTIDSTVPQKVANVIQKGLAIEIEDRIASVDDLERKLYSSAELKEASEAGLNIGLLVVAIAALLIVFVVMINSVNPAKGNGSDKPGTGAPKATAPAVEAPVPDKESEGDTDTKAAETAVYEIPQKFTQLPLIDEDDITYDTEDGYIIIKKLSASITDGKIPDRINGMLVKTIQGLGQNVTNIMLPEGVEIIDENAFKNCVYLESLYIPATVKIIKKNAFVNCQSLKEIEVSINNENYYISNKALYSKDGEVVFDE